MLAIKSPDHLSQMSFLEEEDFSDVVHRALYAAIRDLGKEYPGDLDVPGCAG
jgi:hypothetical protein